ncbi:MAG TPA: YCF48-related protein [Candidatus Acidoferrales bacterium]|nr:YCF48-related protein [Candidatus Acidoferrales bacterium]
MKIAVTFSHEDGTSKKSSYTFACIGVIAILLSLCAVAVASPVSTEKLASKLHWRSVGPYIGGRVVTVTGVPGNADLFYMGTVGGGIWKSTDYGLTWKNISDGTLPSSSPSVGAIAVAPSNPNVLYAGMGESDIRNTMIPGDGIFKSADAGKTWSYMGLRDTHTISNIVIDPKNPDIVYASSMGHVFVADPNRGVFKSTDGGKTWNKILFVDDKTGAINLVMEPNDPNVLYAAMWQAQRTPYSLSSGGPGSGLYKTTDGGAHWTNITRSEGLPQGVLGRIGVSVAAANPSVVYAIMQAKEGGVFRSEDGGKSWKRVNNEMKLRQRAFYYMSIFCDPKNVNTVYVPEVDALWVSRDGGKTFQKLRTPHGDNHVVWINPQNTNILLEGNDGGATVSTDGGKTWSTEHNQPTGQFYHVNLDDQFPYHIYGAQQDEGSFAGPSADADGSIPLGTWQRVAYGESTYSVPQPGDPNITYGSGYYSIFLRYNLETGQYQSVSPWPNYQEGAASNELKYRFGWTHPILFSPSNPKELLIGAQCVLKSDDLGQTWHEISPDLTRNEAITEAPSGGPIDLDHSSAEVYPGISALAVSPRDDNVIWAGSDDGLVHITTDGGQNWQEVNPSDLPAHSWINSIQPSYADAGTAYLAARRYMWDDFKPYVFKTEDYGKHWKSITDGLAGDTYVFDLRQDPNDPDLLLLGTKKTIDVSFDAGAHWQPLALNLPIVQVRDIAFNAQQNQAVIATHGRSFWVLDNLSFLEQLTKHPSVDSHDAHVFAPQETWLTHAYGGGNPDFTPNDAGQNPPFGATIFFNIPADYDGKTPVKIEFSDAQGQLVRSFDLHLKRGKQPTAEEMRAMTPVQQKHEEEVRLTSIEPGMNRFQWDLRYAEATEVKGFEPPVAAGGLDDTVNGPLVVPGTYTVAVDYGGKQSKANLTVALDPRLKASPDDLAARLALQMKIHVALDTLNQKINKAIAVRDKLVASGRASAAADLDREIGDLVQLQIKSSEGSLLHETMLRSHLAYLAADIDLSYTRPTAAQYAVFDQLDQEAKAGEQKLDAAIAAAK